MLDDWNQAAAMTGGADVASVKMHFESGTYTMLEHRIREALLPFAGAMPMERFDAMVAAAVRAARDERIPEVYRTGRVAEPAFPNASHSTAPRTDWLGLGSGFAIFVGLAAAVWFA